MSLPAPEGDALSVQLYSLRGMADAADRIRLVAESGLRNVETSSADHADPRRVRRLLDEHDLTAPSGHYGIQDLRTRIEWVIETAGILGQRLVVLWGFPDEEHWPDADGWTRAGAELGAIAQRLERAGLAFAFHNHDWELKDFGSAGLALDVLFAASQGSALRFQPDLAWLARGGANPFAVLAQYSGRIVACHVKDLAPAGAKAGEEGWADLGEGVMPWNALWPAARAAGARLMVLEHDAPSDPARFLKVSAAAARALQRVELTQDLENVHGTR